MICGISFGLFVAVGAKIHKPPFYAPSASTERCQDNVTVLFCKRYSQVQYNYKIVTVLSNCNQDGHTV